MARTITSTDEFALERLGYRILHSPSSDGNPARPPAVYLISDARPTGNNLPQVSHHLSGHVERAIVDSAKNDPAGLANILDTLCRNPGLEIQQLIRNPAWQDRIENAAQAAKEHSAADHPSRLEGILSTITEAEQAIALHQAYQGHIEPAIKAGNRALLATTDPYLAEQVHAILTMREVPHLYAADKEHVPQRLRETGRRKAVRIAAISDLQYPQHADAMPMIMNELREINPDALVLAGDIANAYPFLDAALRHFDNWDGLKAILPGNHEYHQGTLGIGAALKNLIFGESPFTHIDAALEDAYTSHGIIPLWKDPVRVKEHILAGNTLWYDYSYIAKNPHTIKLARGTTPFCRIRSEEWASGHLEYIATHQNGRESTRKLRWMDRVKIPGRWDDQVECELRHNALRQQLDRAAAISGSIILATHMVPYAAGVLDKDDPRWNFGNAYMGSTRTEQLIREYPAIRTVLHGHSHNHGRYTVNGVDVYNVSFDPTRPGLTVLEVP